MQRTRVVYAGVTALIVVLGLWSRQIPLVPLSTGDGLWAMMIFFIWRGLFINANICLIGILSLFTCFSVEISQLYQAEWLNSIRATLAGRLILGQGFLWTDFAAYTAGVMTGTLIDSVVFKPAK